MRVLLKLSGEALAGERKTGFDEETVRKVALQVKQLVEQGIQVGIVTGGGNFWRGRTSENIDRTKADQIGMLATIMNCIYVSEIFRSVGMMTNVLTPFECGSFTKLFSKDRANKYFEKGMVVFFAGGTGHPYFSTDTGVVLRAVEMEADVILLAKSIDGVYSDDPKKNPAAVKYDEITIDEVIAQNLQVVDMTASILARDNKMPMWVFDLNEENSIVNAMSGKFTGTKVTVEKAKENAKEKAQGILFQADKMPTHIKLSDGTELEFDPKMHRGIKALADIRWYEYRITKAGKNAIGYDNVALSFFRITESIRKEAAARIIENGVSREDAVRPHVHNKSGNIHPSKADVKKADDGVIKQLVLCNGLGPNTADAEEKDCYVYRNTDRQKGARVPKTCYYPLINEDAGIVADGRSKLLEELWGILEGALR